MPISFSRRPTKFRNVKTEIDGVTFASKREANRYVQLKTLVRVGEIAALELQPRFDLVVNGHKVCRYVADFAYERVPTGERVVEDVKSKPTMTREYRIKKKLLKALYGIDIVEVA